MRTSLRLPGMDGFRALAALAIVVLHAYLATGWATAGNPRSAEFVAGVGNTFDVLIRQSAIRTNVFFVLSGLLLALPFVRWALLPGERRPGLRRYVVHRVRRIWPLYLLLMFLAAATVTINRTSVEQVLVNSFLLQDLAPGGKYLLPVTWTLTVELGFYVLLPVVMFAMAPFLRARESLATRVAWLLLVPLLGFVIGCLVRSHPDAGIGSVLPRTTVLGYLDNFAAGIAAAVVIVAALGARPTSSVAARVRGMHPLTYTVPGTFLVVVALVARHRGGAGTGSGGDAWWWMTLAAIGIALWMLAVALRPDRSWLARIVDTPLLLELGRLSYGIFLWHYIVLHWMGVSGVTRSGGIAAVAMNLVIVLVLTMPLAWATWHLVEKPFLDGRVTLPRPRPIPIGTWLRSRPHPTPPLLGAVSVAGLEGHGTGVDAVPVAAGSGAIGKDVP